MCLESRSGSAARHIQSKGAPQFLDTLCLSIFGLKRTLNDMFIYIYAYITVFFFAPRLGVLT